ncbi:metal ABC transporter ATP-binding protein [Corynebacterium pelargi]|uniref:Putative ABC transporter ATP-binding protein n=1 Tax=Corynebacterium pelargi TaxID=1471400 RepID=A0A410W711_9CORY|nr:metal ABC transporter ATP-binding protein [Corynebacterium pelargi]QAU51666.1 putative ABC transporter ATP-binding protein [Corynebacterium pelargi]GGG80364.1 ABC transporter ATP-binding protein [Corynebacterium pelargi]
MLLRFDHAAVDPLWDDLNLTLDRGEFLAILGPNGVGKSTLLNTVLGLRPLTAGSLEVQGKIGFIPQQRMFPEHLPIRARDLVSLALEHRLFRRPDPKRVDDLLAKVGALGIADHRVSTLSGGQQQLIRQAQALAKDPDILLCDEPLLSLDVNMQQKVVKLLHQRCQEGTGVVVVTHGINPVLEYVDKVLYITHNGIVLGSVDEVMNSQTLSELYQTEVTVTRINGKVVVI